MDYELTPRKLFEYARRYADKAERTGRGTEFPTVRMAAKRFKTTQAAIVEAVEDGAGMGDFGGDYFGIAVGVQISYYGYALHNGEGDYQIEAY